MENDKFVDFRISGIYQLPLFLPVDRASSAALDIIFFITWILFYPTWKLKASVGSFKGCFYSIETERMVLNEQNFQVTYYACRVIESWTEWLICECLLGNFLKGDIFHNILQHVYFSFEEEKVSFSIPKFF